jgi:hypothetical protein
LFLALFYGVVKGNIRKEYQYLSSRAVMGGLLSKTPRSLRLCVSARGLLEIAVLGKVAKRRLAGISGNSYTLMAYMTEEEADRLDELWTKTTPEIDTSKPGYFTQHMTHLIEVDNVSAAYLRARADASHKTITQIISELVQEKIAVTL